MLTDRTHGFAPFTRWLVDSLPRVGVSGIPLTRCGSGGTTDDSRARDCGPSNGLIRPLAVTSLGGGTVTHGRSKHRPELHRARTDLIATRARGQPSGLGALKAAVRGDGLRSHLGGTAQPASGRLGGRAGVGDGPRSARPWPLLLPSVLPVLPAVRACLPRSASSLRPRPTRAPEHPPNRHLSTLSPPLPLRPCAGICTAARPCDNAGAGGRGRPPGRARQYLAGGLTTHSLPQPGCAWPGSPTAR